MTRAALLVVALAACSNPKQFETNKVERTHLLTKKLAFECYPQWAAANATKECPDSIADLVKYTNDQRGVDEWNQPLVLYCGANVPAGARLLAVKSLGPDGKDNTPDDIKSWE